jgi:small GTP-binding protein
MESDGLDKNTLSKILTKYAPLVEGSIQLADDAFDNNYNPSKFLNYGKLGINKNHFSVNKLGELKFIRIEHETNINFKLLGQCDSLTALIINNLKLDKLPKEITLLKSLILLDLGNTNLVDIPKEITKLSNLQYLYLDQNNITSIPNYIGRLNQLNALRFRSNQITKLPKEIENLKKLKHLSLSNNKITELPLNLSKLKKLKSLSVDRNMLTSLIDNIGELKKLEVLIISDNRITELPLSIGFLENLVLLISDQNKLSQLPSSFKNLNALKFLLLTHNFFTEFPLELIELKSIENISMSYNTINNFPIEIQKLTRLSTLEIKNNPINLPDPSFHDLTAQEKIQTLIAIQNSPLKPLKQAKILVVGDERVGKTSVINRLLGKQHDENQTSTQGINISELEFDNFKTNIWDFAGQELTHQTHQFFLTERSLYVYVLDAQKEDNQSRDLHWLNTIKSYSDNSPIIIVVNHSDQNLNYRFDLLRYQDNFQIVDVIYTSACNLNALDERAKNHLGDSIPKLHKAIEIQLPKLPGIERELPESWHQVKSSMENFKQSMNVIEKDAYEIQCEKAGVIGKPLQNALLKILNSIGTVVAFPNDFRLQLTQILKPEWVTNAVYKIIRSQSDSPGIYSEQSISNTLDDDYKHIHQQWLVDLLIKFEIGFKLSGSNDLLIPMRLPSVMPEFQKPKYQKGLNIRFNYHTHGLLKLNTLPQLIVRLHHYVDEETSKYWRHGIFVRWKDCEGVIIADESKQVIEVFLSAKNENALTLLDWVRSNLSKIEESQTKANKGELPYIEEVALFDDECEKIIGYAKHDRIQRAYIKGKETIDLEVLDPNTLKEDDREFNVSYLIGLYKKSQYKFDIESFPKILADSLLNLTKIRAKAIGYKEDDINDILCISLQSGGYNISDQSRGGFSYSGRGSGERDIVVLNEYGQQACIIEAMCLTSVVKKTILSHYEKLTENYNTQGNPVDFLVTYAKVTDFKGFWSRYKKNFTDIEDLTSDFTDKFNLCAGRTTLEMEGSDDTRKIIHIAVNFGAKP